MNVFNDRIEWQNVSEEMLKMIKLEFSSVFLGSFKKNVIYLFIVKL